MIYTFHDLALDANDIARRISDLAKLAMASSDIADLERYGAKNKYYWGLAEALGLTNQVDQILQADSRAAFEAAMSHWTAGD